MVRHVSRGGEKEPRVVTVPPVSVAKVCDEISSDSTLEGGVWFESAKVPRFPYLVLARVGRAPGRGRGRRTRVHLQDALAALRVLPRHSVDVSEGEVVGGRRAQTL